MNFYTESSFEKTPNNEMMILNMAGVFPPGNCGYIPMDTFEISGEMLKRQMKSRLFNHSNLPFPHIVVIANLINQIVTEEFNTDTIRVLDVGSNPMQYRSFSPERSIRDTLVYNLFKILDRQRKPNIEHISQILKEKVITCGVDLETNQRTNHKNSFFVEGDYRKNEVREKITETLGGNPHIIFGSYSFVHDIHKNSKNKNVDVSGQLDLAKQLIESAADHLVDEGFLASYNGFCISEDANDAKKFHMKQNRSYANFKNMPTNTLNHFTPKFLTGDANVLLLQKSKNPL